MFLKSKRAFTLIELLVVVLIIGILSAIALPQYERTVLRSRYVQGQVLVESIYTAEQVYYMANGKYADDIDDLDISVPANSSCSKSQGTSSIYICDFGRISLSENKHYAEYSYISKGTYIMSYIRVVKDWKSDYYHLDFKAGERYCMANTSKKAAQSVCEGLGGTKVQGTNSSVWYYYKLD